MIRRLVFFVLLLSTPAVAQEPFRNVRAAELSLPPGEYIYPGEDWLRVMDPGRLGWDEATLSELEKMAPEVGSSAGLVVHRGLVVAAWGDVTKRENSQSMRKSLVSGLVGSLVAEGRLKLDATLAELGVQDDPPLTPEERRATVRDLLHSRSGVYHSAVYEFPGAKERKPQRGAHGPGEHFFYNNWDFNVLETLASSAAGEPLGEAFHSRIARPIGMEDFRPEDVVAIDDQAISERFMGNDSNFPAHLFLISARDLARFGLLYAAGGRWDGRRLLLEEWIADSTDGLPTQRDIEYGYLWWVDPDGTWFPGPDLDVPLYFGRGNRGHYVLVIPSLDVVVVNRVETGGAGLFAQLRRRLFGSGRVPESDFADMLRLVIAAHPGRRLGAATPSRRWLPSPRLDPPHALAACSPTSSPSSFSASRSIEIASSGGSPPMPASQFPWPPPGSAPGGIEDLADLCAGRGEEGV